RRTRRQRANQSRWRDYRPSTNLWLHDGGGNEWAHSRLPAGAKYVGRSVARKRMGYHVGHLSRAERNENNSLLSQAGVAEWSAAQWLGGALRRRRSLPVRYRG